MDVYRVRGTFKMGSKMKPFTKEYAGRSEEDVRERCLSIMGSRHGVSRRFIIIDSMEKLRPDQVTDAVAEYKASKK